MHTTKGITRIQVLLDNVWENTVTGELIRVSIEIVKYKLGIAGLVFKCNYDLYGHLAMDCWVNQLWEFVFTNSIELDDDVREGGMM